MKSLEGVPQWPRTRDSSLFWVASTSGRSSEALSRWTPSESITVPSVKTCSNMPNWLPSFDRPKAMRVKSGSAVVTAVLTRGRGRSPDWPALVEFADDVADDDDDDELPPSRNSRPKKLESSARADPAWNARTSNP